MPNEFDDFGNALLREKLRHAEMEIELLVKHQAGYSVDGCWACKHHWYGGCKKAANGDCNFVWRGVCANNDPGHRRGKSNDSALVAWNAANPKEGKPDA